MTDLTTRDDCERADTRDPLRAFRDEFALPEGVLYLDGNSLGARPVAALSRAATVIDAEWGDGLIRSWNAAGWFERPTALGDTLAPLIGAGPGEVVLTDTLSINVFKALAAALHLQRDAPERRVIVSERDNFPSDLYIAEGIVEFTRQGYELRLIDDDLPLEQAVGADTAVVLLTHANYRTAALYDMPSVTRLAHERGAVMIWDLAHSAGAVPLDLTASGADFAVGCTYKYLNGGPGSPAFLWANPSRTHNAQQPLSGWWSHARPFAMETGFESDPGIRRYLCGTQPMVSLSLVECGLEIAARADMDLVRAKSLALTDLFIELVEARCGHHPLRLITPREHDRRGSHVSFEHPEGYAVMRALIERGVIGDYREPEVLRFGVTPLYLGYADIWDAVEILRDILDTRSWDREEFHTRAAVT